MPNIDYPTVIVSGIISAIISWISSELHDRRKERRQDNKTKKEQLTDILYKFETAITLELNFLKSYSKDQVSIKMEDLKKSLNEDIWIQNNYILAKVLPAEWHLLSVYYSHLLILKLTTSDQITPKYISAIIILGETMQQVLNDILKPKT